MLPRADALARVDAAFLVTGEGLTPWPAPHPDRSPTDEEYSRVTDAGKWRIIGARADAWLTAMEELGAAEVHRDTTVRWVDEPGPHVSRIDRAEPRRGGAWPLVVAHSQVGDVEDAGVTFGLGDPALCVSWLPVCGCDACDSGSQDELDQVDQIVFSVVSGSFRRLVSGDRVITRLDENGWSATGNFRRGEVDAVLTDPKGWQEVCGAAWI